MGSCCRKEIQRGIAVAIKRQQRRRIEREWRKVKVGDVCTKFIERNGLFTIPHTLAFQVVKVAEDTICVYNVSYFDFKEGRGYFERVTVCQRNGVLFRALASLLLGFVSEEDLEKGEEIQV